MEVKMDLENTDAGGAYGAIFIIGFDCDKKKNSAAVTSPAAVIWKSPFLSPRRYRADIRYAEHRQFRANILKI